MQSPNKTDAASSNSAALVVWLSMKAIGREAKLLSESMNPSDGNPGQLERGLYLGIDCGRTSPALYSDKSWAASLDDSTLARELRALNSCRSFRL